MNEADLLVVLGASFSNHTGIYVGNHAYSSAATSIASLVSQSSCRATWARSRSSAKHAPQAPNRRCESPGVRGWRSLIVRV
jgi:cell wall-associated NlpC family hydrolase